MSRRSVLALTCAVTILGGCGTVSDPSGDVATPSATTPTRKPGERLPDDPTEPTPGVELCDPSVDGDTIRSRSEVAKVACDAPEGTNLSLVYATPPPTQRVSIQVASSATRDEVPRVSLLTTGLWGGRQANVVVDGTQATFRYRLAWNPDPATSDGKQVSARFTDEIAVGDTVTHGPLTYTVLGITDTGDVTTSHVDLAIQFDASAPLET